MCSSTVDARLKGPRNQPELVTFDMAAWAAYQHGQADALGLPIVDTTAASIATATDALVKCIFTSAGIRRAVGSFKRFEVATEEKIDTPEAHDRQ